MNRTCLSLSKQREWLVTLLGLEVPASGPDQPGYSSIGSNENLKNSRKRERERITNCQVPPGTRELFRWLYLIDLLDLRARAGAGAGAAAPAGERLVVDIGAHVGAGALVHLGDDGVADALELLHLVVELIGLGELVAVEPVDGLVDGVLDLLLVCGVELGGDLLVLDGVPHVVGVVLEAVFGFHLLLVLLVLRLVLLRLLDHLLDLVLAQPPLVVGDGDLVLLACGLVLGGHVEDAVGVDVEADGDLGHAARRRGDAGELKLAEEVVVSGPGPLALVDLDQDTGLVVGVGGEDLLLLGGDGGVPGDEHRHDAAGGLQTLREGGNDGGLDGGAIGHGLVGVDALTELLAIKEDHFVDGALVHLGVPQALLHGLHALSEEIHVQLLEPGASDGGVEVNALEQGVDLDGGLGGGGERPLRPLAGRPEPPQGPGVAADVLLVLPLELLHEVVHHPVVKVLAAQVGISGGGLDLEDPLLDREQGDVEGATSEVKDEDVLLADAGRLLVESVGDGGGRGLVDDAHDVQARDDPRVLGRLPLRVVEVTNNREKHTEHGVHRVHGNLVLGGVADEALAVGEADIGRRGAVTLVVGDDLHTIVLPDPDARVGRTEINADRRTFSFSGHSAGKSRSENLRDAKAPLPPHRSSDQSR
ncbi:unnamed protein product [Spirodela intermedia]|uniref:Uncharacterized protein n=1 Tax=Spirodela intermedia TaxID=51605 RepID=A0A7I8L8F4_SPIIN|nr:unnamed protein product [Spirodela intermedia]